jgi:hypothetical protein
MTNAPTLLRAPVSHRIAARIAEHAHACELFRDLGQALGVRDLRVSGELGLVEGSIHDQAVLLPYAQGNNWAPFGFDYLSEYFCKSQRGTFVDGGAGIGLWTLGIARDEFVVCKAFEPGGANFNYLASNVRRNCPNGNVEIFNASTGEIGRHLDSATLRQPLAIRLEASDIDSTIANLAPLLEAAEIAVINAWPRQTANMRILDRCFTSVAVMGVPNHDLEWRKADEIAPPAGTFEVLLRK